MKFDLHRLQLLRELQYRGTLTAVAAALSYSPSAISQQLSLLETEVGARLLEPDGRRLRLTPQARILVAHTEAVVERLEQAEADIARSLREVAGTVRVAAFQTAMLTVVPAALSWLRPRYPGLRIEITQAEPEVALSALLPRDFDLVIDEVYPGYPQAITAELDQELLACDPMRLATAGPPGLPAAGPVLRDYAGAPWVMELPGSPGRQWTVAICRDAGFEPDVVYESTDMVVHAELVEHGHAVAFLPDLMWLGRPPGVCLHQLSTAHQRSVVTTCRSGARTHPMITAVRDALRQAGGVKRPSAVQPPSASSTDLVT